MDHQCRPGLGELFGQCASGFVINGRHGLEQHRPGVQARFHLHDGYSGVGVSGQNRALHGCGTAPAREQGAVDIEAAHFRGVEDRPRQDQAIGGNHGGIQIKRSKGRLLFVALEGGRGTDFDAQFFGDALHGRG